MTSCLLREEPNLTEQDVTWLWRLADSDQDGQVVLHERDTQEEEADHICRAVRPFAWLLGVPSLKRFMSADGFLRQPHRQLPQIAVVALLLFWFVS